jgi:uncharacterized protein YecT (DUF1311 family)
MNDGMTWYESVVAYLRILSQHLHRRTEDNDKHVTSLSVSICWNTEYPRSDFSLNQRFHTSCEIGHDLFLTHLFQLADVTV